MAKKTKRWKVHIGIINHHHGTETFVGWTKAAVTRQVYAYVKEWWAEQLPDEPLPKRRRRAIVEYFAAAGDYESLDFTTGTLPARVVEDCSRW
jgi:hypothetical protein